MKFALILLALTLYGSLTFAGGECRSLYPEDTKQFRLLQAADVARDADRDPNPPFI
jgi:hypothetical protein